MRVVKHVTFLALAVALVAASAPSALATKYATNLVSNSAIDPPPNPTLSVKSSVKFDDKGHIAVALAGVTTGSGSFAESSTVYNDTKDSTIDLDGSEYIVMVKLYLPAIAGPPLNIQYVEVPIPVDLKAGKGKTKLDAGPLIGFLGPGYGRGIEIQGVQVWGPLDPSNGTAADDCEARVESSIPAFLSTEGDTHTCRDQGTPAGVNFGMSGLYIPNP